MTTATKAITGRAVMPIDEQLREAAEKYLQEHTRYKLAKDAGVDYASLVRWLDEGSDIRLSTAVALAKVLGLRLTEEE